MVLKLFIFILFFIFRMPCVCIHIVCIDVLLIVTFFFCLVFFFDYNNSQKIRYNQKLTQKKCIRFI